jgi:hypothetical protein
LNERYEDDPSTHQNIDLDLWLKIGLSDRPDFYQVYGLFNTIVQNLQTSRSISTVGCSQSISSNQILEFTVMLVLQTTKLCVKITQLCVEMVELRRMLIEMRSHMGGEFAPPFWPHGPDGDQLPSYFRFIVFERTNV